MSAAEVLTPLGTVLGRLEKVTRAGTGWLARCPAHEDGSPSLSIGTGRDGRVLLKCHAGCSLEAIAHAAQISVSDLFTSPPEEPYRAPKRATGKSRRIAAEYAYTDEYGTILYEAVRFEPKGFAQRQPDGRGGYTWKLDEVKRRVPYRLPEVLDAVKAGGWIFVLEGEKDVDRARSLGLVATTNAGGAGKWTLELCPPFRGARVAIVPDADRAGAQHAQTVAQMLDGFAADWRIVQLPGLKQKGDLSDWLDMGHTVEELRALLDAAEPRAFPTLCHLGDTDPTTVPDTVPTSVAPPSEASTWPDLQPIPAGLPQVEPFAHELLPESFRPWLADIAERMQVPIDFPAVCAMVALGTVIGRKVGIRPKQHDDWVVIPNLWGAIIGRPGAMKSPSMSAAIAPIKRLEDAAFKEYEHELKLWEAHNEIMAAGKGARKKALASRLKAGANVDDLAREIAEEEEKEEPAAKRYTCNDVTVEKLGEILSTNPNGVLVYRDELTGWFKSMDKEGQDNARAFYLEAWAGDRGEFVYDRIGRGTLRISSPIVSVLGGIQPGPLREYIRSAVSGRGGDDGLIQRLQLAVWPDVPRAWKNVDRRPDREAGASAVEQFAALDSATSAMIGAEADTSPHAGEFPFLRFDADAQEDFYAWQARLEDRVRSGAEHPAFESHLAKYRSLVPSLALILHLAEWHPSQGPAGPVTQTALVTAIAWAEYLESHARRIYAPATGDDNETALALARHIEAGDLSDGFTVRDVRRKQWTGLTSTEDVKRALDTLEDYGWVRAHVRKAKDAGRPTTEYAINPSANTRGKK